ncbi:MAG: biopolymer transporter ExbD [Planctomycetaceae bacterium]
MKLPHAGLLLLAALAAAEEASPPAVQLPRAAHAVDPARDGLELTLTATGEIFRDGRRVSLDALAAALTKAVAAGKLEEEAPRVSLLRLRLRIDERAPWRHVQWLLIAAAEAKIYRTEFGIVREGGGEGALPAWLPLDRGVAAKSGPPPETGRVRIRIVAEGEREAKFGPASEQEPVREPAEIAFLIGEERTKDPGELIAWIMEEIATTQCGGTAIEWEIAAESRIPTGAVARLVDALRGLGVDAPSFQGTAPPSKEERARDHLPYPTP